MADLDWTIWRIHAVTSPQLLERPDFFSRAAELIASGCVTLNLRAYGLSGRRFFETARRLRELTLKAGAPLVVGDRIDVALAVAADGVHLGVRSIPLAAAVELCRNRGLRFGYSCHGLVEAEAAARAGAGYLYLGTIFASASKPGTAPCGTQLLATVAGRMRVPVFGIGGIGPGNIGEVAIAGASGAAVITAAWDATDSGRDIRLMSEAFG